MAFERDVPDDYSASKSKAQRPTIANESTRTPAGPQQLPVALLSLQRAAGNSVVNQVLRRQSVGYKIPVQNVPLSRGPIPVVSRRFNQVAGGAQQEIFNGVTVTYTAAINSGDAHIAPNANDNGTMMQDFLMALWAVRDELVQGEARNPPIPGQFQMHPQGAVVLKDTMELLGETFGVGSPHLGQAQNAKQNRKAANLPFTEGKMSTRVEPTVIPEHREYRDAAIGSGVRVAPIGGGTSGGVVDMLDNSPANALAAQNERALYDAALLALRPVSLHVTMNLAQLQAVIAHMESQIKWYEKLSLQAMLLKHNLGL